jgi:DNA-binding CsgD family transcriptional regulator
LRTIPPASRENEFVRIQRQPGELVGRSSELQLLESFLDATTEGPSALLLEGDAGIGKSALWSSGVERAAERDYNVLSCRTTQAEGQLPFVALGDLFERVPEEVLATLADPQRRALEVALLRTGWDGPAIERRAVALGVLGVLRRLAGEGPVVIAVDDLQWLDRASAATLHFALRRFEFERVGLLAARRGRAADAAGSLDEALPPERLRRLELGPLDRHSLSRLVLDGLGTPLSPPALLQVHRVSGGNPFLALEIARALERREVRVIPGTPFPVPQGLRDLVRDRLERIPAAAREVALALAAMAQPTPARLKDFAAGAAGRPGGHGLDEALTAGIIEIDGERVRFTHPLLGSVVYSEASPGERRRLHASLAAATEDLDERARHLALAATGPNSEVAASLDEAARRARVRGSPEAAAELLERAAILTPAGDDERLARRRLEAAERHLESGDTDRAAELFECVVNESPAIVLGVRAGTRLGVTRLLGGDIAGATAAFEQARRATGHAGETPAGIEEGLAWTWEFRGDTANAAKHARAAVRLAERQQDVPALVGALSSAALFEARRGPGGWPHIKRALSLSEGGDFPTGRSHPLRIYAQLLMGKGETERARAVLADLHERSRERGSEGSLAIVLSTLSLAEIRAGRWEEAAEHAREGYLSTLGTGQLAQRLFMLMVVTLVGALRGNTAEVRARAREADELIARTDFDPLLANTDPAVGLLELSSGDPESAHAIFASLNEHVPLRPVQECGWFRFLADDVEALIALGKLEAAQTTLAKLEARRHVLLDRAWTRQAFVRCRGLIAFMAGKAETALDDLVCGVRLTEHGQEPFEHARNLFALGRAQRRLKQRRASRQSLTEACALFERLGAPLWQERATEELARIGGRAPRGSGLTATERRIAELAAEGMTNREIAGSLFLSPNTVQAYLKRIYRELGVRSRTELARKLPLPQGLKSTDSGVSDRAPGS